MTDSDLLYEVEDRTATITLNRPDKLNAITPSMRASLFDLLDRADDDDDVRVVIVTGAGRAFCAGIDLSAGSAAFSPDGKGADGQSEGAVDSLGPLTLRLFSMKKLTVAAINGLAVGLGATMTLAMDIRIAADDARAGFVFTRRGVVPDACSSWFLPRVVGISRAMEWIATGRMIAAPEMLSSGLVRSLHPTDELMPEARRMAADVVRQTSPVSVALSRQLLWSMLGAGSPRDAAAAEARALFSRSRSADAQEGIAAYVEKRDPMFPDRVSDLEELL